MDKTIYLCENSTEGILTAVYDAWASRRGHSRVKLKLNQPDTLELFADYVTVAPDLEKAEKVRRSVMKKISRDAWEMVYRATLSEREGKADDIYRFLVGGFYYGASVVHMMAEPVVMRMVEMNRAVGNEAHYTREFLRFDEREGGILFARIRVKNDVLTLVAPHFADRLSGENFLILDVVRSRAAVHPANRSWYITALSPEQAEKLLTAGPDEYRELWKTFFHAIAIESRKNPELQRNRMPLHYREFAPEFVPKHAPEYDQKAKRKHASECDWEAEREFAQKFTLKGKPESGPDVQNKEKPDEAFNINGRRGEELRNQGNGGEKSIQP